MKRKIFRVTAIVLAATFVFSMFSGCGTEPTTNTEKSTTASNAEPTAEPSAEPEKTITLTRLIKQSSETYPAETTRIEKDLEKKFNVVLKRISAPNEDSEYLAKLNSLVASGQTPDIITIYQLGNMVKFAKEGLIGDFKNNISQADMPLLYKLVNDEMNAPYINYNGGLYGIPNVNLYTSAPWFPMVRKDWVEELGLKLPESIDEFYTFAKTIKEKKNIYPIGACYGFDYDNLNFIFGAFDVIVGGWQLENDKVVSYDVSPKMKDALAFMRKLKADGLLDPDWSTQKEEAMFDKWVNGKIAILSSWNAHWWRKEWDITAAEMRKSGTLGKDETFDPTSLYSLTELKYLGRIEPLKGPDGKVHGYKGLPAVNDRWAISKEAVDDPDKISRILKLVEYSLTDEGALLIDKGYENETYVFDANGYVTKPAGYKLSSQDEKNLGIATWDFSPSANEKISVPGELDKPYDISTRKYTRTLPVLPKVDDYLISETWAAKNAEIKTKRDEYFYMIVNGSRPLEDFDKWVEEFKAMGMEQISKEFTDSYNSSK